MEIGFETIGNAILICYDQGPLLATDPWLSGRAYFGSWTLSHQIPPAQRAAIAACPYLFLSHGHPDHLCLESLAALQGRGKRLLLANHVGDRIRHELVAAGYEVRVLPDRTWVPLSDRVRVLAIADYSQDSILLVDLDGKLVVNTNDAWPRGWRRFVRSVTRRYGVSFLLSLSGCGDAPMMNLAGEDGRRIEPLSAERVRIGTRVARRAEALGARYFVPFSSMHRYQRADSVWANAYVTTPADYADGFASATAELLPAFVRYDAGADRLERLDPPETPARVADPAEFGDDWTEPLAREDEHRLTRYIRHFPHLASVVDFVAFRVGGREHVVTLGSRGFRRGVTLEAPRSSLVASVRHETLDDLLIGNFARATLHGRWPRAGLHPDFTMYVAKYGDNGRAYSPDELRVYFDTYRQRAGVEWLFHRLGERALDTIRRHESPDSAAWPLLRRIWRTCRDGWPTAPHTRDGGGT